MVISTRGNAVVSQSSAVSRGERRRSATRTALVAAAEDLFAARGADAVTIDEIVARADVAKGSFYNHFASRDDLAREIARAVRDEIETEITAANAGEPDPAVRMIRANAVALDYARRRPVRAQAQARLHAGALSAEAPMNKGVRADLEAGLASGRFRDITVGAGVIFVLGVAVGGMAALLDEPTQARTQSLIRELGPALLRGLGLETEEAKRLADDAADRLLEGETP
jgi:AcrR family transcriptional regulator